MNLEHSDTQTPDSQARQDLAPKRRRWLPWVIGGSLAMGAGALSRNNAFLNVNTGNQLIQVIQPAPP